MPSPEAHVALRYMRRFRCVGGACEETCCAGWTVPVDRAHHQALKKAMGGSRTDRERFRDAHVRNPDPVADPRRHALLKLLPSGSCTMLTSEGMCSTQARFGEALLPDTCATYPRVMNTIGERIELSGSLSCPEASRLALLAHDALELDVIEQSSLPRMNISSAIAEDAEDHYARYLDPVRGTILGLLSLPNVPLSARMFLVARMADRTRPFFHRGCSTFDEALLARELDTAVDETLVRTCVAGFRSLQPSGPRAGFVLVHALRERLALDSGARSFRELVRTVFDSYGALDGNEVTVEPAALLAAYHTRRDPWQAQHGDRIDAVFTNYAKHYWLKDWFLASPNLLIHAQKLHLRVALLRFLLLSHPELGSPSEEDSAARLEKVAVRVVYKFARANEHSHEFVAQMESLLQRLELTTLAQSIFLLAI